MNLSKIRQSFNEKKGEQKKIKRDLEISLTEKNKIEREISISEKSQMIIQAVAQETQNELQYRITEPVSLALEAVYPEDPYRMKAEFSLTGRGNTECHLGFERNGFINKPLDSSGGGPIDISSFALRVGGRSLHTPIPRPIFLLDEPFKWVDIGKMPLAAQMLKEFSEELLLQIIMISHLPGLIEKADRIIWVVKKNKKTSIDFAGNIDEFLSHLKEKKESLSNPNEYHKKLFDYFLRKENE